MYSYVRAVTAVVNKAEEYLSLARTLKDDSYWTSRAYGVLDSWRDEMPKHLGDLTTMAHKHAELIHAWADGAEIQCSIPGRGWVNVPNPMWALDDVYRVKPKIRSINIKYRVALFASKDLVWTDIVNTEPGQRLHEEAPSFVRWLTNWIEYDGEIEE